MAHDRASEVARFAQDPRAAQLARRRLFVKQDGRCPLCPLHRGENNFGRKDRRSWKTYRDTKWR